MESCRQDVGNDRKAGGWPTRETIVRVQLTGSLLSASHFSKVDLMEKVDDLMEKVDVLMEVGCGCREWMEKEKLEVGGGRVFVGRRKGCDLGDGETSQSECVIQINQVWAGNLVMEFWV